MTDDPILVIDQGSHASRAMVFDPSMNLLASARVPVSTRRPVPGQVEQDGEEILASIRTALETAISESGVLPSRAGLATQRSSVAFWDAATGKSLAPVLSWQDTRAALPTIDPGALHQITGLRASPHYGASKLRWALDRIGAVRDASGQGRLRLGPLSSFLVDRLCKDRPYAVDPCNASRTLLYDWRQRSWSVVLQSAFGLDDITLPSIQPNASYWGVIESERGEIPLTLVTGDQSAVPFGVGPVDPGRAWVQFGTGAFVQQLLADDDPPDGLLASVIHDTGDRWWRAAEGTINGAGAAIDWAASSLGIDWDSDRGQAGGAMGRGDIPIFINGINGLGSPDWRPDFPSRFLGDGDPMHRLAGVLESVVFLVARNLERLEPDTVVASGGLSQLDPLCQSLADLQGIPVMRTRFAEATARGVAALMVRGALGWAAEVEEFLPRSAPDLVDRFHRWNQEMP